MIPFEDDEDDDCCAPGVRFRLVGGSGDGEVHTPPESLRHLVPFVISLHDGERYRVDPSPAPLDFVDGDSVHCAYVINRCSICYHEYDELNDGCTCTRDRRR